MTVIDPTDGPMATAKSKMMIAKGSARMASTIRLTTESNQPPK